MAEAASFDARLQGFDFAELIGRAENQHQKVEERRLACAQSVFRNGDGDGKSGPHTESRGMPVEDCRLAVDRSLWIYRGVQLIPAAELMSRLSTSAGRR